MADADFTLKLVDMLTGPARRAAASAQAMVQKLRQTQAAAEAAGKGSQHLDKLARANDKAATAAERLAVAEARAAQVTAAAAAKAAAAAEKAAAAKKSQATAGLASLEKEMRTAARATIARRHDFYAQQRMARERGQEILRNQRAAMHNAAAKKWNANVAARQAQQPAQAGGGIKAAANSMFGSVLSANLLSAAIGKVVSVIGSMVAALGRAAMTFGGMVIDAAFFADRQKSALGILLKSTSAGEAAYRRATKLAREYGLAVQDTVNQFARLVKQGFTPDQAEDLVKMAADMQALGATTDEVSRVLETIGKIKAAGNLQGDELNMLAEAGVNIDEVYKALAKNLGKSVAEVKKLKEAGKITAEEAIKAIQEATLKTAGTSKLGEAAKRMSKTLNGAWNRFKAAAEDTLLTIGEKLIPKLVDKAVPLLEKLMKWADSPAGAKFVDDIVEGFGGLIDMLGDISVEDVTSALTGIADAFRDIKAAAQAVVIVFRAIGYLPGVAVMIKGFQLLLTIINAVRKAIEWLKGGEGSAVDAGGMDSSTMPEIIDEAALAEKTASAGKAVGASLVQGIVDGITAGLGAVAKAASAAAQAAVSASQSALDAHSPSRVFRDLYASVPAGAVEGIVEGSPRVQSAAANMISTASVGGTRTTTSNNVRNHAPVNITIPAAADPQATAAIVAATLESRIAGMFQDATLQVGVIGTTAAAT